MQQLTLEQQAQIRSFEFQVKEIPREQLEEMLVGLWRMHLIKDNYIKSMLKESLDRGHFPAL